MLGDLVRDASMTDAEFRTLTLIIALGSVSILELSKQRQLKVATIQVQVANLRMRKLVVKSGSEVRPASSLIGSSSDSESDIANTKTLNKDNGNAGTREVTSPTKSGDLIGGVVSVYSLTEKFDRLPNKRFATAALAAMEKESYDSFPPLSLTGLFLSTYEQRYKRTWRGSRDGLKKLHEQVELLFQREGAADTAWAIQAVFSPKLKWATNQMGLLLSRDAYTKFVVPVISLMQEARRGKGEQAEWDGDRTDMGSREIEL